MKYNFADTCLSALLECLFGKYLEGDGKGETIFTFGGLFEGTQCSPREYYCIGINGAPSMVGRSRGFAALLKEKVFTVCTVHCVLHRHHLVAKKVCIRSVNKIKAHHLNS